jgi:hypothetical protein
LKISFFGIPRVSRHVHTHTHTHTLAFVSMFNNERRRPRSRTFRTNLCSFSIDDRSSRAPFSPLVPAHLLEARHREARSTSSSLQFRESNISAPFLLVASFANISLRDSWLVSSGLTLSLSLPSTFASVKPSPLESPRAFRCEFKFRFLLDELRHSKLSTLSSESHEAREACETGRYIARALVAISVHIASRTTRAR